MDNFGYTGIPKVRKLKNKKKGKISHSKKNNLSSKQKTSWVEPEVPRAIVNSSSGTFSHKTRSLGWGMGWVIPTLERGKEGGEKKDK